MTFKRLITILMAVAIIGKAGYAQYDLPTPVWASFHLNPKVRITMDYRNASVDSVIHALAQASGVAIVKDPTLTGTISVESPKPQSLNDAFALFDAVLGLKNFQLVRQDTFLVIKAKPGAGPGGASGIQGLINTYRNGGFGGNTGQSQSILKVYRLKYANATELARVINEVFAPNTTAPANPFAAFGFGGGGGGPGGGGPGGGGRGGRGAAANQPTVKASADDYSNSIIVNAASAQQGQIAILVEQIDQPTTLPQVSRVFTLQYALASNLESIVQNILSASMPLGRGGTTTQSQNSNRGGFPFFFGQQQQNSNTGGTVSADEPTNSLIVTATQENMDHVAEVVQELDRKADYQSMVFVYVMKNARADVVANLLNSSFGNRVSSTAATGGSLTNTGPSQGTISTTGSTSGNGGSGTPSSLSSNTSYGNRSSNNSLGTTSNSQSTESQGLDESGHVVNVHNFQGVLLVPNIDTNSIIVYAPPEDKDAIISILDGMDEIPKQVMIEALVVETNLTKANQFGVEYSFNQGSNSTGTISYGNQANTTQPQGLRYSLTAGQYSLFLSALETDTGFNVLSTPRIFTTNNATAQINISQSLPYVTNQTVDTTGTVLYNYDFLDVGIVLTVTPRITDNGYVTMDVSQTANDFVGYTSFNAPIVNQREAQTTVSVKDGETIVLGGLDEQSVNDTVNKVPILGDLPLIGNLFRSVSKTNAKTELLVFLTPHIVSTPDDARKLRDEAASSDVAKEFKNVTKDIPTVAQPPAVKTNSTGLAN